MHRVDYEMLISAIENDDTKKLIGKLDIDVIKREDVESLYYEFPLIERIVLEIYKLLPLSDVEYYEQGTMRTIIEIINKDSNQFFPDNLIMILRKYFGDTGLRNRLFHVKDDIGTVNITKEELDFKEIKFVIMQLLSILRDTFSKYDSNKLGNIRLIQ